MNYDEKRIKKGDPSLKRESEPFICLKDKGENQLECKDVRKNTSEEVDDVPLAWNNS